MSVNLEAATIGALANVRPRIPHDFPMLAQVESPVKMNRMGLGQSGDASHRIFEIKMGAEYILRMKIDGV